MAHPNDGRAGRIGVAVIAPRLTAAWSTGSVSTAPSLAPVEATLAVTVTRYVPRASLCSAICSAGSEGWIAGHAPLAACSGEGPLTV